MRSTSGNGGAYHEIPLTMPGDDAWPTIQPMVSPRQGGRIMQSKHRGSYRLSNAIMAAPTGIGFFLMGFAVCLVEAAQDLFGRRRA